MKKRASYVLAAACLLLVCLAGCGGSGQAETPASASDSTETPASASSSAETPAAAPGEAAGREVTMQEMMEANTGDRLWERGSSVLGASEHNMIYLEPELYYINGPWGEEIRTPELSYVANNGEIFATLYADELWDCDRYRCVLDWYSTPYEEITSVEERDGTLVVATAFPEKYWDDWFNGQADGLEEMGCTYYLDPETLALQRAEDAQTWNGVTETTHCEYTFNAPRPAELVELLERLSAPDSLRTVTMVVDPGSPDEARYSVTTLKGVPVSVGLKPEDNIVGAYDDEACTQEHEPGSEDRNNDVMIYFLTSEDKRPG